MSQSQDTESASTNATGGAGQRSAAEWLAFGIAAAILLAVLSAIGYFWATQGAVEPHLVISQTGEIRQVDQQFYLPYEVRNLGGATVADVQLAAELTVAGQEPQQATQQIGFLAGGQAETGAFIFASDPRQGELTLLVTGYNEP